MLLIKDRSEDKKQQMLKDALICILLFLASFKNLR